jgi:hypothetical protein
MGYKNTSVSFTLKHKQNALVLSNLHFTMTLLDLCTKCIKWTYNEKDTSLVCRFHISNCVTDFDYIYDYGVDKRVLGVGCCVSVRYNTYFRFN